MSSPKTKHVHYDRGTKGEKKTHSHRSSRDSGVGSSSASDRASLGEEPSAHFSRSEIESQRHILSVVQEALDAANEKIKALEAHAAQLDALLADRNKENKLLKREKGDLHNRVEDLLDLLGEERKANERLKRSSPPRSPTGDRPRRIEAPRPQPTGERRNSYYERPPMVPAAPQNPFTPLASRPVVTYAPPAQVTYAPSSSYTAAPVFAVTHSKSRTQQPVNDGRYHLTPL